MADQRLDKGSSSDVLGDLDGDGFEDFAVGSLEYYGGQGVVYVVRGPVESDMSLADADARLEADDDSVHVGRPARVGDLDGDGRADLAVGVPRLGSSDEGYDRGAVYLFYDGHGVAATDLDEANAVLLGEAEGDQAGGDLASADLDGDGVTDLVIGARFGDAGHGEDSGAAYVVFGPVQGTRTLSDADYRFGGVRASDRVGWAVAAGDVDGDGVGDVVLGVPMDDTMGRNVGATYLFYGPLR